MYETLVEARMLAEAREFGKQHPMPEPLPEFREAGDIQTDGPTERVVHPTKYEVLRRNVALADPVKLVVVSHPVCHFSSAAMRDIQADLSCGSCSGRMRNGWLLKMGGSM